MSYAERYNAARRERYCSDPEYRAHILEYQRADRMERSARLRNRYRLDDDYRQKCIERARRYHASKRGEG